jgi:hypothetical protein
MYHSKFFIEVNHLNICTAWIGKKHGALWVGLPQFSCLLRHVKQRTQENSVPKHIYIVLPAFPQKHFASGLQLQRKIISLPCQHSNCLIPFVKPFLRRPTSAFVDGPVRIQMTSLTILVGRPSLSSGESKLEPSLCNAKAIPLKWTFVNDLCCVPVWVGAVETESLLVCFCYETRCF